MLQTLSEHQGLRDGQKRLEAIISSGMDANITGNDLQRMIRSVNLMNKP